jgi:metal-responsive CopG/Arc/MetJ family transcriptional regulator
MPRKNRNLTEKITIQITRPMLADLHNVATKSGKPLAEIIRQAIRNALDDTDLTLGTRRTFDRRFQKRLDGMESKLEEMMETYLQRRTKDSEMAERYFQVLAMLYARLIADLPIPGQTRTTWRMLNQAILDTNSNLGRQLREQLEQLQE